MVYTINHCESTGVSVLIKKGFHYTLLGLYALKLNIPDSGPSKFDQSFTSKIINIILKIKVKISILSLRFTKYIEKHQSNCYC